ncbi:hypothetical protein [Rhizobium leguminosarum]|uniref:hypothetical protein n=1 Tax=Rhizobium leguminosarum TaxID=384 RepID=UPI002E0D3F10|nr:hypothetical protein U8Q02_39820 [Rhizobium leguminosarum]
MSENPSPDVKALTVEKALRRILALSQDASLTEERLRAQVRAYAETALEQVEAAKVAKTDALAVEDGRTVAWVHVWSDGSREVRSKLESDRYGLASTEPLTFVPNGEIVAWRWADGGGYNADHRYSFVDPLEEWDEVEAQGASSVISCRALYRAGLTDIAAG